MIRLYHRVLSANSSRYSAAAMPSGTARMAVVTISHRVPRMPARKPVRSGKSVES